MTKPPKMYKMSSSSEISFPSKAKVPARDSFSICASLFLERKKAAMNIHPLSPSCYLLSFGTVSTRLLPLPPFFLALVPSIISFIIFLVLVEQTSYLRKKGGAPGPVFVLPFIGNAISLVRDPTSFWDTQSSNSSRSGFSANYIMGRFMLYIRDTNLSHLVFSNVRPDTFLLVGHPFGKKLFGEHNLIYMSGQEYKDLRRRIAPNFTPRALSTYTSLQQIIILKHLKKRESLSSNNQNKPISLRMLVRDMNLETSQTVFVGPYLSEEARELAVDRLAETLSECAIKSKTKMGNNHEPSCLIDFWMQEMLKEIYAAKSAGEPVPPHTSDTEIGGHLFEFLYAAQDASTSS
ncbi:hypothetical protein DKX38_006126 [Salix brachista]|uniref:C-22 sterol desaturase n=1 Tax=Salix brachista TaxID=2182728 RepID=A0A5N5N1G2_9ROSI|nr:hypothetical protein DKX38_006126 [Salix brachista]